MFAVQYMMSPPFQDPGTISKWLDSHNILEQLELHTLRHCGELSDHSKIELNFLVTTLETWHMELGKFSAIENEACKDCHEPQSVF